jgi:hypothetical protein
MDVKVVIPQRSNTILNFKWSMEIWYIGGVASSGYDFHTKFHENPSTGSMLV